MDVHVMSNEELLATLPVSDLEVPDERNFADAPSCGPMPSTIGSEGHSTPPAGGPCTVLGLLYPIGIPFCWLLGPFGPAIPRWRYIGYDHTIGGTSIPPAGGPYGVWGSLSRPNEC